MIKGGSKDTAKVIPNPDNSELKFVTKPIKIADSVPPVIPAPKPKQSIFPRLIDRKWAIPIEQILPGLKIDCANYRVSCTMSSETFSRAYLQAMPYILQKQVKDQFMIKVFETFIKQLQNAAAAGKTSYIYDMSRHQKFGQPYRKLITGSGLLQPSFLTDDDMLKEFEKKFPDCKVSFYDGIVDSHKEHAQMRGIIIDWS